MTDQELGVQMRELKEETLNLRLQQQSGQLESPTRIRTVRRTIARIETILSQRAEQAAATTAEA